MLRAFDKIRPSLFYFATFTISLIFHLFAGIQFYLEFPSFDVPASWFTQVMILLGFSLALSFLQFLSYRRKVALLFFIFIRVLILEIVGLPLGDNIGTELTLLTAVIFEIGIYFELKGQLALSLPILILTLFLQRPVFAWETLVFAPSPTLLFYLGFYPLIVMVLSALIKLHQRGHRSQREAAGRIKEASLKFVEINITLQEKIAVLEEEAARTERRRIAEDLHDLLGYSFMNIKMMMEAVLHLPGRKNPKVVQLLESTKDVAQEGLNGIRRELRAIREKPLPRFQLKRAIHRIVNAFQFTHIRINVNYGDIPRTFGDAIDVVIYRLVQEGITNAIRHGKAEEIDIHLRLEDGRICVTIRDNGTGSEEIVKGIGISAMQERVARVNGELTVKNTENGFYVYMRIPWQPPVRESV